MREIGSVQSSRGTTKVLLAEDNQVVFQINGMMVLTIPLETLRQIVIEGINIKIYSRNRNLFPEIAGSEVDG